jgi:hypothetical protein
MQILQKQLTKELKTELIFIPIQEKFPENYNCQILVKKENENFCDLRFFHHEDNLNFYAQFTNIRTGVLFFRLAHNDRGLWARRFAGVFAVAQRQK